jgi:hypothetical protein
MHLAWCVQYILTTSAQRKGTLGGGKGTLEALKVKGSGEIRQLIEHLVTLPRTKCPMPRPPILTSRLVVSQRGAYVCC